MNDPVFLGTIGVGEAKAAVRRGSSQKERECMGVGGRTSESSQSNNGRKVGLLVFLKVEAAAPAEARRLESQKEVIAGKIKYIYTVCD
jgi:hypothetical protein